MAGVPSQSVKVFAQRLEGVVFAMHVRLPFFAMLLESCSVHYDTDDHVKTATVDVGGRITIGTAFAAKLTDLQLIGVLAHEVCHVAFGHFTRIGSRDRVVWNIAGDYAINYLLVQCLGGYQALPSGALINEAFAQLDAEQIYETIVRDAGAVARWRQSGGAHGHDMVYEGAGESPLVRAPRMPVCEEANSATGAWRQRVAGAAVHAAKWGELPDALSRCVEAHSRSKVDWVSQLRRFLRFGIARDGRDSYTFVPCSRRHVYAGLYLPSLVGSDSPRIAFAVDTSGSMGAEAVAQAYAEVDAIRRQFACQVYLLDCDAVVHSGRWIGPFEALPMPKGGGGTDFRPVFRHLKEEQVRVDVVVYVTDGFGSFGADPEVPTIWVMTSSRRPPWGDCVQVGVDA
jgi:predicted metal-dependent peptidase